MFVKCLELGDVTWSPQQRVHQPRLIPSWSKWICLLRALSFSPVNAIGLLQDSFLSCFRPHQTMMLSWTSRLRGPVQFIQHMLGAGETRMCTLQTFILSKTVPSESVSSRCLLSLNPMGICFHPIFSTLTSYDRPSCPGQRSLACCCPWGHKKSWTQLKILNNHHIGKLLGGSFLQRRGQHSTPQQAWRKLQMKSIQKGPWLEKVKETQELSTQAQHATNSNLHSNSVQKMSLPPFCR